MNLLIKNARIVDKNSIHNGKSGDILIENGIISKIGSRLKVPENTEVIEHENLHVSIGWFDFRVNTQDPGFEYKEDIPSLLNAAEKGGFTGVCTTASTLPPISSKSDVKYILNQAKGSPVEIFPCGTLSENMDGKNISEMYDMQQAGAVAFSDNKQSVEDSGLMARALLYAKNFNGLIMNFPLDKNMSQNAMVNESATTTKIGLKGAPTLAEELMVARDIYLAEYHNTKVHIGPISCKKSVELIREAKNKGLNISSEVAIHNLLFTDEDVFSFDTNFKVNPPYRSKEDRNALISAVVEGVIDIISSDHTPEDVEHKKLEFEHANYGIIGLQTLFSLANEIFEGELELADLIQKFSINPRTVLQLDIPKIEEGYKANLTLFNPDLKWTFAERENASKSNNSPFLGKDLKGKSLGIIRFN